MNNLLSLNTRQKLLIQIITTCLMTYLASTVIKLSTPLILAALGIGILHVILKRWEKRIKHNNQYKDGFRILFFALYILSLTTLTGFLPEGLSFLHALLLLIQILGFYLIGNFLLSIKQKVETST